MCPKFGEPLCTASDLENPEVLRTTFHGYDQELTQMHPKLQTSDQASGKKALN